MWVRWTCAGCRWTSAEPKSRKGPEPAASGAGQHANGSGPQAFRGLPSPLLLLIQESRAGSRQGRCRWRYARGSPSNGNWTLSWSRGSMTRSRRESGGKTRRRRGWTAMAAPGRRPAGRGSGRRMRPMSSSFASTPERGRRPSPAGGRREPASGRRASAASGPSGSACRRRRTARCGRPPPRGSRLGTGVTTGFAMRKAARPRPKSGSSSRAARPARKPRPPCGGAACSPRRRTPRANS